MAKLKAIPGGKGKGKTFSLVYGLRLYPAGEVVEIHGGQVTHDDDTCSTVTLHLIEGTREQIRAQLLTSIEAFFDIHNSDDLIRSATSRGAVAVDEVEEPGC